MSLLFRRTALAAAIVACAQLVHAQTVDEVIAKSVEAAGGRAAFARLKSRSTTGTITLSTPAGAISGAIEVLNAAPNKSRSLIKADLSALGAGQLTLDQRFNGTAGYVIDSVQGNHEMTGGQLEMMRNSSFPNPFLSYKEMGIAARLVGKEKVGDRDAYALVFEPPSGPAVREYLDAETYLPLKTALKIDVPQLGQEVEQTTEFSDYRDVDGVKLPFLLRVSSPIQNYTIAIAKVEHNVPVDDALFSKPATP